MPVVWTIATKSEPRGKVHIMADLILSPFLRIMLWPLLSGHRVTMSHTHELPDRCWPLSLSPSIRPYSTLRNVTRKCDLSRLVGG